MSCSVSCELRAPSAIWMTRAREPHGMSRVFGRIVITSSSGAVVVWSMSRSSQSSVVASSQCRSSTSRITGSRSDISRSSATRASSVSSRCRSGGSDTDVFGDAGMSRSEANSGSASLSEKVRSIASSCSTGVAPGSVAYRPAQQLHHRVEAACSGCTASRAAPAIGPCRRPDLR